MILFPNPHYYGLVYCNGSNIFYFNEFLLECFLYKLTPSKKLFIDSNNLIYYYFHLSILILNLLLF